MPVRAPLRVRSSASALSQGEYFGHCAVLDLSPAQVELGPLKTAVALLRVLSGYGWN